MYSRVSHRTQSLWTSLCRTLLVFILSSSPATVRWCWILHGPPQSLTWAEILGFFFFFFFFLWSFWAHLPLCTAAWTAYRAHYCHIYSPGISRYLQDPKWEWILGLSEVAFSIQGSFRCFWPLNYPTIFYFLILLTSLSFAAWCHVGLSIRKRPAASQIQISIALENGSPVNQPRWCEGWEFRYDDIFE